MKPHVRLYVPFTAAVGPALLAGILSGSPAAAAGVTAGTLIENTAVANYDEGGVARSVNSNTVTVRVDELLDVTVTSLDPGPITAGAGTTVLTYELTNQGNGPEAFRLIANTAVAGNNFDSIFRAIAIDSNNNGTYDEGVDQILAQPQTTELLAADARLRVFVLVEMPQGTPDGQNSNVELIAEAVTGNGTPGTYFSGAGVNGGYAIVGTTGAQASARGALINAAATLQLVKSVALRDPFGGTKAVPGTIATFTIQARVNGTGSVANLVVTDPIPAGTTYAPGTLALDSAGLSDAPDGDAGAASDTDGIAVQLGNVAAGTTRMITFDVVIDE
jgi:uncharacterized repeat protein (TIGR01451 family)